MKTNRLALLLSGKLALALFFLSTSIASAQLVAFPKDTAKGQVDTVIVTKVLAGDRFWVVMPDGEGQIIRVATTDCFGDWRTTDLIRQAKQAGIEQDFAMHIGRQAAAYAEATLTGKRVILRVHPDHNGRNRFAQLIRTVEVDGKDYGWLLGMNGFLVPNGKRTNLDEK